MGYDQWRRQVFGYDRLYVLIQGFQILGQRFKIKLERVLKLGSFSAHCRSDGFGLPGGKCQIEPGGKCQRFMRMFAFGTMAVGGDLFGCDLPILKFPGCIHHL